MSIKYWQFSKTCNYTKQGRHGCQSLQGLGLAWILQNEKQRRQRRYATDVAATVVALPDKNGRGGPVKIFDILVQTRKKSSSLKCFNFEINLTLKNLKLQVPISTFFQLYKGKTFPFMYFFTNLTKCLLGTLCRWHVISKAI